MIDSEPVKRRKSPYRELRPVIQMSTITGRHRN